MSVRPQDLVEHALAASRADDTVVVVRDVSTANLRWATNTLTTNGEMHTVSVSVVAFRRSADGVRTGSVSGRAATVEQVEALVAQADEAAGQSRPAEDAADLVQADAADDDWSEVPERTSIGVYADLAPRLGEVFARSEAAGRLLYGFVDHVVTTTYLGSSTGLRRRHVQPSGHYGCTGKPADLSQSVWTGGATRDFTDVDVETVEAEIARRLAWGERRVDLPAGRYDTVLPPSAVADLAIDAYWYADARLAVDGQSAYSRPGGTRLGEQVARPGVRLWSDPHLPGLECTPYDVSTVSGTASSVFDTGLPLTSTDWLRDGVLTNLISTRRSAAMVGREVTPAIGNLALSVDGATGTPEDLVAGVERGLLLTCLWYLRVVDEQTLLLTGLTRDGVYLVEDGEVTALVNNFRFNESPLDLLRRFTHASATAPSFGREWGDEFTRTATPALRVPDFHMSTVSQAS